MEMLKDEMVAVAELVDGLNESQLHDLSDLQLALVGGGVGDVIIV